MENDNNIISFGPSDEALRREELAKLARTSPIPDRELMMNIGLYLTPQNLSRILFMDFLYKKILEILYHWSSKINVWSWNKLYRDRKKYRR